MFHRLRNGWELAKGSWRVLMLDKEMLFFPLMSGIATLAVMASFALPLIGSGYLETLAETEGMPQDPLFYVGAFAFYFVTSFVVIFFNSALVAAAIERFRGGDPNVMSGLRAATARLPQILGWSLVAATVGFVLKAIESRSERVGQIVAGLLGLAWGVVTYLVVPVLVVEGRGPMEALRRSTELLRRSWGEAIGANFGIGLFVFLAGLVAMAPAALGIYLTASAGQGFGGVAIIGIMTTVFLIVLLSLVSSALKAILVGALYEFAADDRTPAQFDPGLMNRAFRTR